MSIFDISLTGGMRASLLSLQGIKKGVDRSQERLSTGRRVNSALDNPTNFFAATAHKNRAADLNARKDGINEAIRTVDAGNNGITAITSMLNSAQGLVNAALGTTDQAARASYSKSYDEMLSQVDMLVTDSSYRGTNLLTNQSLLVDFTDTSGQSSLGISGVDASITGLGLEKANSGGLTTVTTTNVGTGKQIFGANSATFTYAGPTVNTGDTITATLSISSSPDLSSTTWMDLGNGTLQDIFDLYSGDPVLSVAGDSKTITVTAGPATIDYFAGTSLQVRYWGGGPVLQRTFDANLSIDDISSLKVGGSAKTLGTDYTLITRSSDGLADIVFNIGHAPANGAAITVDTITTTGANPWTSTSNINKSSTQLDSALSDLRFFSKQLSNNSSILATRLIFTDRMVGVLIVGADNLTLADMNEESANMLMLQTRLNIGTSSLSLGARTAQSVMQLF